MRQAFFGATFTDVCAGWTRWWSWRTKCFGVALPVLSRPQNVYCIETVGILTLLAYHTVGRSIAPQRPRAEPCIKCWNLTLVLVSSVFSCINTLLQNSILGKISASWLSVFMSSVHTTSRLSVSVSACLLLCVWIIQRCLVHNNQLFTFQFFLLSLFLHLEYHSLLANWLFSPCVCVFSGQIQLNGGRVY